MRIRQIVENVTQDMSYALRGFRRSPGFTVSVIVMLALGIGANTAMFSFVDRLLIRQLPYPQSNQLVVLYETFPSTLRSNVSPANWLDWQRLNRSFETLAAWNGTSATLTSDGDPELIFGQTVSSEFFPALRVQPHLGRLFTPEDDGPYAPSVVILSLNLWRRRFGGDSNIVGKKIELDSVAREVIGVLPPGLLLSESRDGVLDSIQPWSQQRLAYQRRAHHTIDSGKNEAGRPAAGSPGRNADDRKRSRAVIPSQQKQFCKHCRAARRLDGRSPMVSDRAAGRCQRFIARRVF